MTSLAEIEAALERPLAPAELLRMSEQILAGWVAARGGEPTQEESEGFRLLALHRQGARGVPSFNACRETCREIAYHYNLLSSSQTNSSPHQAMMTMLVRHLALFVYGKMEVEGLGEFCCSSRPLRLQSGEKKEQHHA